VQKFRNNSNREQQIRGEGEGQAEIIFPPDPDWPTDAVWFERHPRRRYYARSLDDDWVALIWQAQVPITKQRAPGVLPSSAVLIRTYSQLDVLPDNETTCQRAFLAAAYPGHN
jgi:hypothetical protein